jgi:hypothetical protein
MLRRYCKAEQVSGQTSALSPSRDTGLSTGSLIPLINYS